jgi:hypothetical protein
MTNTYTLASALAASEANAAKSTSAATSSSVFAPLSLLDSAPAVGSSAAGAAAVHVAALNLLQGVSSRAAAAAALIGDAAGGEGGSEPTAWLIELVQMQQLLHCVVVFAKLDERQRCNPYNIVLGTNRQCRACQC